jgi:hypothetical protein
MDDEGFCKSCETRVSLIGAKVVRSRGTSKLIIDSSGRCHNIGPAPKSKRNIPPIKSTEQMEDEDVRCQSSKRGSK